MNATIEPRKGGKQPDQRLRVVLGARVRRWRERRGYSQEALARLTGVTQGALSNYESGKREVPLHLALSICSALDVPLSALLPLEVDETLVVEASRLGRAIQVLRDRPDLLTLLVQDQHRVRALASPGAAGSRAE